MTCGRGAPLLSIVRFWVWSSIALSCKSWVRGALFISLHCKTCVRGAPLLSIVRFGVWSSITLSCKSWVRGALFISLHCLTCGRGAPLLSIVSPGLGGLYLFLSIVRLAVGELHCSLL